MEIRVSFVCTVFIGTILNVFCGSFLLIFVRGFDIVTLLVINFS